MVPPQFPEPLGGQLLFAHEGSGSARLHEQRVRLLNRDEQDNNVGVSAGEHPSRLDSPHARHALVHYHQARFELRDGFQCSFARCRLAYEREAFGGGDELSQSVAKVLLIIDDENANAAAAC